MNKIRGEKIEKTISNFTNNHHVNHTISIQQQNQPNTHQHSTQKPQKTSTHPRKIANIKNLNFSIEKRRKT